MRDPNPAEHSPRVIRREDYRVPDFLIDAIDLYVDIREAFTRVTSTLQVRRNPASTSTNASLLLDGEGIALREISLDGAVLDVSRYLLGAHTLEIPGVPDAFVLCTVGEIDPASNTALEGLYMSHGMYCTQCEAEGFRRITWYPDRPDVLARFTTTVEADAAKYPLLLSNGNCVKREALADGRHRAVWQDPYPKPCYLFALVAGDLACLEDVFVTRSGRRVALQIFVEPHDLDKTRHAMDSLQRAMKWDEDVFGCEYDLDVYMIVAVSHFNMGAMENKGLNVFNTSCVLANSRTQTDKAFQRVEAVIAHEYFHNWSGNRVTCRDWFQLSLKEGFTVFRDAEFSKDMHSRAVKRIEEANMLRTAQFPEDAGPLAHPVRPDSYVEINNFYTVTVYEKGAEVVRMIETLLGHENFIRGARLYFDRHDGQAATCEDFVLAMEAASGRDLAQFRRWYSQAGTPRVVVSGEYDVLRREYRLRFTQVCPATPGQVEKEPFVIPVLFGLVDSRTGLSVPVVCDDARVSQVAGSRAARDGTALFVFDTSGSEVIMRDVQAPVLPSLLRGFSAPVRLDFAYSDDELAFLARYDADDFNRWDAGQTLALRCLVAAVKDAEIGVAITLPPVLRSAISSLLARADEDPALAAEMIALPSESYIADQFAQADPAAIQAARRGLRCALASTFRSELSAAYRRHLTTRAWDASPEGIASRAWRNAVLDLLMELGDADVSAYVESQFARADNMTDQLAALRAGVHGGFACADTMLEKFHDQWRDEALVMDAWFSVQATSPARDSVERVRRLLAHPDFELTNPNRVRAVVGAFANVNAAGFHRGDGEGYRLVAGVLMDLDQVNPQISARIASAFSRWRRCVPGLQSHAAAAMDTVLARQPLSPNLYEVMHKTRQASI